ITNLREPKLLDFYEMENPHGLAVQDTLLFVCEGHYGLKLFEINEGAELSLIHFYHNIRSNDVIVKPNNLLIVIADDGLFQYDFSDLNDFKELSHIQLEY